MKITNIMSKIQSNFKPDYVGVSNDVFISIAEKDPFFANQILFVKRLSEIRNDLLAEKDYVNACMIEAEIDRLFGV